MEPSPERDGECLGRRGWAARTRPLQWSRRLNATERDSLKSEDFYAEALQWSRRLNATESPERGPVHELELELQWSRRLNATESPMFLSGFFRSPPRLQWSRRLNATERVLPQVCVL